MRLPVKVWGTVLWSLAMLGNGYKLNGIIEYLRYYVGALLCSTGVGRPDSMTEILKVGFGALLI